jgi:hypothetical protein
VGFFFVSDAVRHRIRMFLSTKAWGPILKIVYPTTLLKGEGHACFSRSLPGFELQQRDGSTAAPARPGA